jgi:hypothetical protein
MGGKGLSGSKVLNMAAGTNGEIFLGDVRAERA